MMEVWASQVALAVKDPPANAGDVRDASSIPGSGRSLGGGHATHSSILAWRIPWTEEPGRSGLAHMQWFKRCCEPHFEGCLTVVKEIHLII